MWFDGDNLVLVVAQALCVALPAAGLPAWLARYGGSWWALVLPVSIVAVVGGISLAPGTADVLTWIALIGVPIGAALAFGWAAHGARAPLAIIAALLLALCWAEPHEWYGQLARTTLVAGSAVTVGRLLAGGTPLSWLKAGVYAMAALDAYLVFSGSLEHPNSILVAASPGPDLPRLQSGAFGSFSMGYGDFLTAAVVGAILAAERKPQVIAAATTLVLALAWDQLFLVYDVLPATIPPALALLAAELPSRVASSRSSQRSMTSRT
jgi:prepilin signal peptidase PulO-like enzyme (type II secretory pathway)